MKDKQEELKGLAQSQRFGLSGKTETCSDESCDWSAPLDCYRLFRRDKQGRRGTAEEGEEEAQGRRDGTVCNRRGRICGAHSLKIAQLRASG